MPRPRDWDARIRAAQKIKTVDIGGVEYERLPNNTDHCRDCGVGQGQLHVENCCVERCPRCRGQAVGCDCFLRPNSASH